MDYSGTGMPGHRRNLPGGFGEDWQPVTHRRYGSFADALKRPDRVRRLWVHITSRRTRLPDLRQFANLEELWLRGNTSHVDVFPESALECPGLVLLGLQGSSVRLIPPGIRNLTKLEALHLSGNKLTKLPSDIVKLPQLRLLDVAINQIETLPRRLGDLGNLETLMAYNNRLKALPSSTFELSKLRRIELQNNQLRRPPVKLLEMKSLQYVQTDFEKVCKFEE